jgi:hypothetical protein
MNNPDYGVRLPVYPDTDLGGGYRPNINCIHFYRGRCAHPSARRAILPNKRCVLLGIDERCAGCRYQVENARPNPPANPPPMPPVKPAKAPGDE